MKTAFDALAFATIQELQTKLSNKEISRQELLQYCIERLTKYNPELNAAYEVFEEKSILQASEQKGILNGIPGLIKDNISQKDRELTCGSKILQGFRATYDATAITRLKQEGGLLIGRANMDEFAMGSSGETSAYTKAKNPWDLSRVPGGSSSGSGVAVAAGLVPWSLGTETGGSVRQPAAFCGIVGFKPTYGLISRYGLVAYGSSLDQIGIFSRSVYDNALVLSAMAGNDEKDSSSVAIDKKNYTQSLDGKLPAGLRIGIVENALYAQGMDPQIISAIEDALKVFEKLGATTKRVTLKTLDYSAATYFIISRAEAASNLARFDGVKYGFRNNKAKTLQQMYFTTRQEGFGTEVKARILVGNYVLSAGYADAYHEKAKLVRDMMRKEFIDAYKNFDLLIMPTSPCVAFKFGAFDTDKLQMDLQDYFTCAANLTGVPAISIPCGMSKDNLPIGLQLYGPHLSEELIFKVAHAYEKQTQWRTMHPPKFSE
jgi:aspartyl-tRNA(Asn)/glutamyl-tRNA(Gln) amidotransferase subunit A